MRCVVCCWAGPLCVLVGGGPPASRPRHELRSARRLEARPGPAAAHQYRGQALRSLRRPPHRRRLRCGVWPGASFRSPARPRHRPPVPRPGPPVPPAPSTPAAFALRGVAWRVVSKPGQAPPPPSNFARNSPATLSNIEFRSLGLQRFRTLLKLCPIELRARFRGSCTCRPSKFACNSFAGVSWFET